MAEPRADVFMKLVLSTILCALYLVQLPCVRATPQPCHYPRQYETRRVNTNYFRVVEELVGVDCDRQLVYLKNQDDGSVMLIDLASHFTHMFMDGACVKYLKRDDEVHDFCSVPGDAEFLGAVSLDGEARQGWGSVTSASLQLSTIVTVGGQESGQCMPFVTRLNSGNSIVMAQMFYDASLVVTQPQLFDMDTRACVKF